MRILLWLTPERLDRVMDCLVVAATGAICLSAASLTMGFDRLADLLAVIAVGVAIIGGIGVGALWALRWAVIRLGRKLRARFRR